MGSSDFQIWLQCDTDGVFGLICAGTYGFDVDKLASCYDACKHYFFQKQFVWWLNGLLIAPAPWVDNIIIFPMNYWMVPVCVMWWVFHVVKALILSDTSHFYSIFCCALLQFLQCCHIDLSIVDFAFSHARFFFFSFFRYLESEVLQFEKNVISYHKIKIFKCSSCFPWSAVDSRSERFVGRCGHLINVLMVTLYTGHLITSNEDNSGNDDDQQLLSQLELCRADCRQLMSEMRELPSESVVNFYV